MPERILTNHSSNAAGTTVAVPSWARGVSIDVGGTFDTATVTASVTAPGMPAVNQADTWTEADSKYLERQGPYNLILTVSSVGGSTSLQATAEFKK